MSVTTTQTENFKTEIVKSWKTSEEGKYTENNLIDAYLKGKKVGANATEKLLKKAFEENFSSVSKVLIPFFSNIESEDSNSIMHLKIVGHSKFEVSITISEEFYLLKKIDLFSQAIEIEDEVNSDTLSFYINFLPLFEDANIDALDANGYRLKYVGK